MLIMDVMVDANYGCHGFLFMTTCKQTSYVQHLFCVDTAGKKKEQQLQAEVDTIKRVSRAKDQQISELTQKLEAQCQRKSSVASQDLETIQRKSKARVNINNSADK